MTKRALCVGINNYPGTANDLRGCVNDALQWEQVLRERGYDTTHLLDSQATKKGMVDSLTKLIASRAAAGDSLVFTYSGHGSYVVDTSGDESDQRDECLCPHDIDKGQLITDDELATIFGRKREGVHLYFISDSCHLGTVSRFADFGLLSEADQSARVRFLPPEVFTLARPDDVASTRAALKGAAQKATTRQKYPAVLFAACRDTGYSYDAQFGGVPAGAFTYCAIKALAAQNPKTPADFQMAIRNYLPSRQYQQSPQLYASSAAKRGPMF